MYRFRYLDEEDRKRWPDWYEVDMGAIHQMDSGIVMDWEEATGFRAMDNRDDSPANYMAAAKRREMKALLAAQWLAVRLSGDGTPWREFRPKAMQVEYPAEALDERDGGNPQGPAPTRARAAKASRRAAPRRSAN